MHRSLNSSTARSASSFRCSAAEFIKQKLWGKFIRGITFVPRWQYGQILMSKFFCRRTAAEHAAET